MQNKLFETGKFDTAKLLTKVSILNKQTGYSIYNKDAKKRTKQNTLPSSYPELPNKKFDFMLTRPGTIMKNCNLIKTVRINKMSI